MFISSIYSCVNNTFLSSADFSNALIRSKTCPGGHFTTADSLARLRFCNIIDGPIAIENIAEDVDPTVFWDINTVTGGIVIRNNAYISSLDGFVNLQVIGNYDTAIDGSYYALIIASEC